MLEAWYPVFAKVVQGPPQVLFLYLFIKTENGTSPSRSTLVLVSERGEGPRGVPEAWYPGCISTSRSKSTHVLVSEGGRWVPRDARRLVFNIC